MAKTNSAGTFVAGVMLPISNPICTHDWQELPNMHAYVCAKCQYLLTDFEVITMHEGDSDV